MKTKYKHFGNSAIALVLSAIMLLSSSIVGSSSTIDTKAIEAVTESPAAVEETTPAETVTEDALTEETAPENGSVFVDNEVVTNNLKDVKNENKLSINPSGSTGTIYFARPGEGWSGSDVYIWAWDPTNNNYHTTIGKPDSGSGKANWTTTADNIKMTLNTTTRLYEATIDSKDTSVIFKDTVSGAHQTDTLTGVETGKLYTQAGVVSDDTYTIFFKNTANWSTVCAHYWVSSSNKCGTAWPGVAMSKVDGTDDVYSLTVSQTFGNVIFTDGASSNTTSTGTYSLSSNDGKIFNYGTSNWSTYNASYTIATTAPESGTLSFTVGGQTKSTAAENDVIAVNATRDGYTPIISVTNTDTSALIAKYVGNQSFSMPAANITISATFVQTTDLTITPTVPQVNSAAPGTVSPASATVTVGETATFTATENSGYGFTGWTIGGTEGTDYILVSGTDSLELKYYPLTANATVRANFEVDNNVRIYFYRCDQWVDVPYVRYTTDTGTNKWDTSGAVDPFAMTLVDSSRNLYTAKVPAGSTIYFQNGSEPGSASINYSVNNLTAQANYAYASNDWYSDNRNSVNVKCSSAPYEITLDSSKTYIVYSTDAPYGGTYGWVPTYAYMWKNGTSTDNTFPGVLLSKVSGFDNLYAAELTDTYSNYNMLVFHDGSGVGVEDGNGYDYSAHKSMDLSFSYSNDVLSSSKDVVWYPQNTKNNNGDNKFRQFGKTTYAQLTGIDTNEPEVTATVIPVYAKSGTVRDQGSSSTAQYNKYSELSDTTIYTDGHESDANKGFSYYKKDWWGYDSSINGGGNRVTLAHAAAGTKINIKTTIKEGFRNKYYVKAFCINGDSYNIIKESEANKTTGVYTCSYIIPKNNIQAVEITPIYYYFENGNSSNFVTLSVEDFAGSVKKKWGNTIACYAWYANGNNGATAADEANQQALGGYPGQPMIYEGGSYYMQLPKSTTELGNIKGITLNNYVWDDVHGYYLREYSDFNGLNNTKDSSFNDVTNRKRANAQTYDYDDFAALKDLSDVDQIIFSFKYRTYDNHDGAYSSDYAGLGNRPKAENITATDAASRFGENVNGWNVLVDYDDNPVDLFGNNLKNTYANDTAVFDAADSEKLFVVSDGYINYYTNSSVSADQVHNKYLGEYATKWYVYKLEDGTYKYQGALPPSAFITTPTLAAYTKGELSADNATAKAEFAKYLGTDVHTAAVNKLFDTYVSLFNEYKGVPVEITYESALNSNGRYNANSSNWGYRNDGRWYYSRLSQTTIYADTKILIIDSNGTVTYDLDGESTKFTEDPYLTNRNIGSTTGAQACIDNSEKGLKHKGATSLTGVEKDSSDYFQLQADSMVEAEGAEYPTFYTFVGWYLETGGGVLNEVNGGTKGYRQMSSNAHFVAVYSKTVVADQNVKYKGINVTHDPYADQDLSSADPAAHNGTGITYVESIKAYDSSNNLLDSVTGNEEDALSLELWDYDDTHNVTNFDHIEVTIRTVPKSSATLYEVYQYNDSSSSTSNYTAKGITGATNNDNGYTKTYTYTRSELFGDANNEEDYAEINLYSDLKLSSTVTTKDIPLEFNFYDRSVVNNATATIKSTPTTLHYTLTDISDYASLKSKLGAFVGETSEEGIAFIGDLTNVIDEYYIWSSQTQAINATAGLGGRVYYKDDTFTNGTHSDGSVEKYKDHSDYATKKAYHTDYLGNLQSGDNVENWVTYYDSNNNPIAVTSGTTETVNSQTVYNDNVDPASVSKVVLWAFNEPKQYTLTVCTDKKMQLDGDTEPVYHKNVISANQGENENALFFFGDENTLEFPVINNDLETAKIPMFTGFYNQRVGVSDVEGKEANGSDGAAAYLQNYFGRANDNIADIAYTGQVVEAPQTATGPVYETGEVDENDVPITANTYYFDGWYIKAHNGKYEKVSSDRVYGNRITSDLTLYPMYKTTNGYANGASSIGGATATSNGKDVYVDEDYTKNVRLNTQLNVYYNGKHIDNDANIKQVSVVYVNLHDDEAVSNQTIASAGAAAKSWINTNSSFLTQATSPAKVRKSGKVTLYDGDTSKHVVIMDTYQNTKSASGNLQITLTSKNRLQFVLPMPSELYDGTYSNLIAFVAIQYDNGDGTTTWHVSDNYVPYIPGTFESGED